MLTIWGSGRRFCDGVSRRDFLKIGAFGTGLSLADLLRARSLASPAVQARRKVKSAIMIYLPGGPSHLDMYDLKPNAPLEFRGEFKPIAAKIPGVEICELFPRQAAIWDKLAVIRSLSAVDEHNDSLVMTGVSERANMNVGHPSFGAVVSKVRSVSASSGATESIPPFVSLRGMTMGTEPGLLGVAHRPFTPSGPGLNDLKLPGGVSPKRLEERKALLSRFDDIRRDLDQTGGMSGLDSFAAQAFDMVASGAVVKALDLGKEEPKSRDRYKGIEQFLTARRLVEAGVGCVTLSIGGWDTHAGNFKTLRRQLPMVDRAIANLVEDLDSRGMLEETAIVMWGEFGRTPRVNNNDGGRDHWSPAMSALIAGGGFKTGQTIGATDARGERIKDRPLTVPRVLAMLYRSMGIDPATTFPSASGRPLYLVDDREPIAELV